MIRRYTANDLDDVLRTWEAASALAHPFLSSDFLEAERLNIGSVHLPNADTWVWEEDGTVVGFIALIENEVGAIFLDPDFHGRGIGRLLMDHARKLHGELEVEVFTANAIGRAFYDRYGFEFVEKRLHEPTGHEVMRLRLRMTRPRQPTSIPRPSGVPRPRRSSPDES